MTDKVKKIKEEIERRINAYKEYSQINYLTESTRIANQARLLELRELKDFIDSPEEHASENLEEEINHISKNEYFNFSDWKSIARHFAEWQKEKDFEDLLKSDMSQFKKCYERGKADAMKEIKELLQTEYEKGRFDMREEMMKESVQAWVNTYESVTNPYDNEVSFITNLSPSKFKNKETVKVIIVKED